MGKELRIDQLHEKEWNMLGLERVMRMRVLLRLAVSLPLTFISMHGTQRPFG